MFGLPNIPLVQRGDNIAKLVVSACGELNLKLGPRDVVVVAQKIVSKAEGRLVHLVDVTPSEQARELARRTGRDPRLCQVYIDESAEILGTKGRMVITRHKLGIVNTGACVDRSNVAPYADELVVLLPSDPDASARAIRSDLRKATGVDVAVVVNDSLGRADREGSVGMAIGFSGIRFAEQSETKDLYGNPTSPTVARVDELAAAASMLMGQSNENIPVVIVRGASYTPDDSSSLRNLLVGD